MQARILSEQEMLQSINPSYTNVQDEIHRLTLLQLQLSNAKERDMESRKKLRFTSSGRVTLALLSICVGLIVTNLALATTNTISGTPIIVIGALAGVAALLSQGVTESESIRRKLKCTSEADISKDIDKSLLSDLLDSPHRENFLQELQRFQIAVPEQATVGVIEKLMKDEMIRLTGLRHYFSRHNSAPTIFRQNPANALPSIVNENTDQVKIDIHEVKAPTI